MTRNGVCWTSANRSKIFILLTLFALGLSWSWALPVDHLDAGVEAPIHAGTFLSPSNDVRPKYRYWIPDGSINTTFLAEDISALAERGAGGIQFLNYFFYGGYAGTPPAEADWNIYGYGTPAYRDVLKAALQTTKDNGLVMDFALGPQSGQGVPAEPDELGLSWEMVSYNTTINRSGYDGQLPGWGSGDLISAVTFKIENITTVPNDYVLYFDRPETKTQYTINWQSLTDLTQQVSPGGHIRIDLAPHDGDPIVLYASYARRSYSRACIASSETPQNIIQNGSFAVDHFSPKGAKLTTDFLEQYILIDGIKELFMEVGNYFWEDSVEIRDGTNFWTPGLDKIFLERNGYSLTKYAPLIWGYGGDISYGLPTFEITSDNADIDSGFHADLHSTMAELYGNYLSHFVNWAHSVLELQFSAQVGYNLPVDMLQNIPLVDAPETETLSFVNNIDAFRQYAGPADLAGKRIISIELGADYRYGYTQTLNTLLSEAKRSYVAGINQLTIHGATYSHAYPNTTWPGYSAFSYSFAAHHSRHQPAWDIGYPEAVNWLARVQWVLQAGVPKVDLVFWDKQLRQNPYPNTTYVPSDLSDAGYTYSYLTAENFDIPAAIVHDGELAPTRQAFKALVLRGNDTLTSRGVDHIVKIAHSGFPIFFSGGIPTRYATSNRTEISIADSRLRLTLGSPNVHQIAEGPVGNAIKSAGILPRTKVSTNGTWFTRWRETRNCEIYVFVYNDGNSSVGNISFLTTMTPFILNAWTGDEEPVLHYSVEDGYTTIPFSLAATQAIIIRFSNKLPSPRPTLHVTSAPLSVLGFAYSENSTALSAKIPRTSDTTVLDLSNGASISVAPASNVPVEYKVTNWTLTVEKWLPPSNPYDVEIDANKTHATFSLPGPVLPPWSTIEGLSNTSGIGHYATYFNWPPSQQKSNLSDLGAYLYIPPVAQGLKALLNGRQLPTLDITNPQADITSYLVQGSNYLEILASTTLFNTLRPIWDDLLTGGNSPESSLQELVDLGYGEEQAYGVIGSVTIVPYQSVRLV
ncbi:hypothetical protein BJX99DRAFT_259172 [Aspergillus californicus]